MTNTSMQLDADNSANRSADQDDDHDDDLTPLLSEPFASAWIDDAVPAVTRQGLSGRLAQSLRQEAGMVTTRRRRAARRVAGPGVIEQLLYQHEPGRSLRPGEPLRARLLEFAPGAQWQADALAAADAEWLVVAGTAEIAGQSLGARDHLVWPAGQPAPRLLSAGGALVFVRESPSAGGTQVQLVRDADAGWPGFAPGLERRVLWQQGPQAAMLYRAAPGASVPSHMHGHDEECLMLDGELFLDDVLLQPGDYQIAPVGSGHRVTQTDTGVVIYAHGDLDLQFVS